MKGNFKYHKLKGAIAEKGYTQKKLALSIGITPEALSYKINNVNNFRQKEILDIMKELKLKNVEEYFFTEL